MQQNVQLLALATVALVVIVGIIVFAKVRTRQQAAPPAEVVQVTQDTDPLQLSPDASSTSAADKASRLTYIHKDAAASLFEEWLPRMKGLLCKAPDSDECLRIRLFSESSAPTVPAGVATTAGHAVQLRLRDGRVTHTERIPVALRSNRVAAGVDLSVAALAPKDDVERRQFEAYIAALMSGTADKTSRIGLLMAGMLEAGSRGRARAAAGAFVFEQAVGTTTIVSFVRTDHELLYVLSLMSRADGQVFAVALAWLAPFRAG